MSIFTCLRSSSPLTATLALQVLELRINSAAFFTQALMRARFHDFSFVQHINLISLLYGESLWAITIVVRPLERRSRADWTLDSLSASRAEVASSSSNMGASCKIARAKERRCLFPSGSPEMFFSKKAVTHWHYRFGKPANEGFHPILKIVT